MSSYVVIAVCAITIAIIVIEMLQPSRLWAAGGKSPLEWGSIPRLLPRYFGDVHDRVAREPLSARMHALTAGSIIGLFLLSPLNAALVLTGAPGALVLAMTGTCLFLVAGLGAGIVLQYRRRLARPERLSGGIWARLRLFFSLACVFFLGAALTALVPAGWPDGLLAVLLVLTGAAGLCRLAAMVARGPMRHAFAGAVHLVNHPRPERFTGRASDLKPLDLEAPRLGAGSPTDFSWKQLAAFDACVQCGRCEVACPAFAAGLPLNPKKLIADLSASMRPVPARLDYYGSPHPGQGNGWRSTDAWQELVAESEAAIAPETLWSCTTCRACVEECPMLIEHVDAIVDMRRFQTLERGATPEKSVQALTNLRMTDTIGGADPATRLDFATDLKLPLISATGSTDTLLWLSEAAFDRRGQMVLRAFVRLLREAGVDFAVLGADERDCGDLARRLGDEHSFQIQAKANIATLARYRFRQIVTIDPHALHCLRNEYPAFGGMHTVRHHTDLLDELVAAGRLRVLRPASGGITYHDPCYLGRYNGEFDGPRRVLGAIGFELAEMAHSRTRSRCCGGGGGGALSTINSERRIPDMRMGQAIATGAPVLAVACPGCTQMLEGVAGEHPPVRDIAELLLDAVEARA
ncbi:hypothetical protein BA190_07955 [Labrys sp. WJW]|nr:DUF3483 domain-containing protein [Labrys sp. WJW]OCC05361.1 hypothetical protein BA190_07955 [Labrys sp. WJW]